MPPTLPRGTRSPPRSLRSRAALPFLATPVHVRTLVMSSVSTGPTNGGGPEQRAVEHSPASLPRPAERRLARRAGGILRRRTGVRRREAGQHALQVAAGVGAGVAGDLFGRAGGD